MKIKDFLGGPAVENPPANAGDVGLIPGQKRSPVLSLCAASRAGALLSPGTATMNTKTPAPRSRALQQDRTTVRSSRTNETAAPTHGKERKPTQQ